MRNPVFTGSCPALATPFDQNGNINYDAFGRLIDAQIAAGVDAVCVCGTTGESATMSIREHIAAVDFCVKRVDHRVKVIAGSGSNDTSAAVYLTQHAQDSGADAALLVTPYYNKASQTGLIKHYEYIAERTELPMILYNVPSRTGVSFTAETYEALSANPRINGIKEEWANFKGRAQELELPSAPKQFIHYFEEPDRPQAKLDRELEGGMAVSMGRLRPDTQYDYKFVGLAHNTRRGAAGGAVLLAELLCAEGYIDHK